MIARRGVYVMSWWLVQGIALGSAYAQIPDKFTNLQVLPKDITRADLVGRMRNITTGLGVRCTHCHVGPDNLEGMNFATDDKAAKRAAREMLRMVQAINQQFLAALPAEESRQTVECYTCHRGQQEPPRALHLLLAEVATRRGVTAAVDGFRTMRKEHLGAGTYDFRAVTLNRVGTRLLEAGKIDDAIAVLEANLEFHPDSGDTYLILGRAYLGKGDVQAAVKHLGKALELDPNNEFIKQMLEQAKSKLPKP